MRAALRFAIAALLLAHLARLAAEDAKKKEEAPEPVVFFDEETALTDGLKRIDASVAKGDAKGASIWLQKLLNEHGQNVLGAGGDLFLPAWQVLSRRAGKLPKDARDTYLGLYAEEGRAHVKAAIAGGDLAAIESAAQAYFPALADAQVVDAACTLAERGRLAAAEALLEERVLQGAGPAESPVAAMRLALLYAARGDRGSLVALRAALPPAVLSEQLSVGCEPRGVGEAIDAWAGAIPVEDGAIASSPGGGVSAPPAARDLAEAPAWSREVPILGAALDGLVDAIYNNSGGNPLDTSMPSVQAIFPLTSAITDDLVLVHLGKSLFAYRISDGGLAWTRGGERNLGEFLTSRTQPGLLRRYAIVAQGALVLSTFEGHSDTGGVRNDLVALSPSDGRVLWKLDGGNAGKEWSFLGVPHLDGDRVYVGAIGTEAREQLTVLCLEAATGKVVWTCKLASTTPPPDQTWSYCPEPVPVLTTARGLVCVCTGTGAFAAIDPATGAFAWGLKYACSPFDGNQWVDLSQELCWLLPANPLLPSAEGIWMAPSNAPRFYLVDMVERRIRLDHRKDALERYRYLVGRREGALVLGGPEVGIFSPTEGLRHHWQLRDKEGMGRPALAGGLLLVPRRHELAAVDAGSLAPAWRRPLEKGASGDVLVSSRGVAIVSPHRVTFFPWK